MLSSCADPEAVLQPGRLSRNSAWLPLEVEVLVVELCRDRNLPPATWPPGIEPGPGLGRAEPFPAPFLGGPRNGPKDESLEDLDRQRDSTSSNWLEPVL